MKEKIKKWIDNYLIYIIYFGYYGIAILVILVGIICLIGRFVTIINSDIPTWLKWQLLTR